MASHVHFTRYLIRRQENDKMDNPRLQIFAALFAAIMIALSMLKFALPFSPVPITFSTLGIMLAGSVLGARNGTLAVLLVILMCAAGLPVLGGTGGFSKLIGPTAGYILAWPFAAFLIGYFAQRLVPNKSAFAKVSLINFLRSVPCCFIRRVQAGWLMLPTSIRFLKC